MLGYDISNTDAMRWHDRSQNFLDALKSGDTKSTYQHYQPGVTIMWIGALVKQLSFSYQYNILHNPQPLTLQNADFFPVLHGYSKLILIILLASVLIFQYHMLTKLFGVKVAVIYGLLLSLEPYFIGMDRWFHLTSLESYFAFSSLLSLLVWSKFCEKKYLVFSSIFFSLSVLSKLTTFVTIPVYLYVFYQNRTKINLKLISLFFGISILTFALMFPAFLFHPFFVMNKLVTAAVAAVGDNYRNDLLTPLNRVLFYPLVLLIKLSPITLLLLLLSFFKVKGKILYLNLFIYYLFLSVSDQKIDRYSLAMFPTILLLCSIYLSKLKPRYTNFVLILTFIFTLYIRFLYYPVYSAYYSPLVGYTKGALSLKLYDNSGEYFAQAARYLNTKGRDTKVYIPDGFSSFAPFYKGKYVQSLDSGVYVVSALDLTRPVALNYGCSVLDKSFGSKEHDIVFVFKCI